ncbi:MAG: GTP cyclohydrolase I FolE [Chloroflexi bacterium CG07_land_8_20_14_0_80_51_10]|nr:MAG: GTP cyclohydrolase I FolE [Chloroflexi bacterium CG07_land_8_20_14_0_80_51_10]
MIDQDKIRDAVISIIEAIGENPKREGLVDTPKRIAEMYADIFSGIYQDPETHLHVGFEEGHEEMVIAKDIPFYSMCEHHFLPFYGMAHIGYIPNGRVVGASKLARTVEILARRPQLQERLTTQVADTIVKVLEPKGVAVILQAEHLCMTMRGVKKPGSNIVTSAMRGLFRQRAATRAEFLTLIGGNK